MNGNFGILAAQVVRGGIGVLQPLAVFVELARVGRPKEGVVDDGNVFDPADRAFEREALAFDELSAPASFDLVGQPVQTSFHVLCCRPGDFPDRCDILAKHTGDRRLLDHLAIIAAVQIVQDAANDPGVLDQRQQVAAGALIAASPA